MGEFPRATPGANANPILDSRWYNRVTDAVAIIERLAATDGFGRDAVKKLPVRCKIRNDSGGDVPPGGVLKLADVIFTPTDRATVVFDSLLFAGDTPAVNEQHVAICEEPIASGRFGSAVIPGAAWVQVNISNSAHTYAKPKVSVAELESDAATGFPIIWKESGTGVGKWAVVSLIAPGSSGNIIYAQVVGNVTSGDPTFTFDNAVAEVGSIPTGGTGTAQNQYGQEYVDNEWVHLFQRKDNGQWLTERGGTALTVLRFETTAAKDWDASTVAGVLLDASDAPVGGAITLTDREPAKHEALIGSRGWCVRNGEDYWIITMDSPARWVEGTLTANWDLSEDHKSITVTAFWGAAPNHLEPETSTVDIYDNIKVRSRKYFTGEKFRALWDETLKLYVTNNTPGDYITIKGTTGAVSRSDASFTLAEVVGVNGQVPTGTITVTNDPPINTPGGRTVYARFNYSIGSNLQTAWDTGDGGNFLLHFRGLEFFGDETRMVPDSHSGADPHWHKVAACAPPEA